MKLLVELEDSFQVPTEDEQVQKLIKVGSFQDPRAIIAFRLLQRWFRYIRATDPVLNSDRGLLMDSIYRMCLQALDSKILHVPAFCCLAESLSIISDEKILSEAFVVLVQALVDCKPKIFNDAEWSDVCCCVAHVLTLSEVDEDKGLWLFAALLHYSNKLNLQSINMDILLFESTHTQFLTVCRKLQRGGEYSKLGGFFSVLKSDINSIQHGSHIALYACISAMMVALHPTELTNMLRTDIQKLCAEAMLDDTNKSKHIVIGLALTLLHTYMHVVYNPNLHDIVCLLRASSLCTALDRIPSDTQSQINQCCLHLLKRYMDQGHYRYQNNILKELNNLTEVFYAEQCLLDINEARLPQHVSQGSRLFEFATSAVDIMTRQGSNIASGSTRLIIESMGHLQAWRSASSDVYRNLLVSIIQALKTIPQDAEILASSLEPPVSVNPVQLSRLRLKLSLVFPCCHGISLQTIKSYIWPLCMTLMDSSYWSLTPIAHDFCCSIFSHPELESKDRSVLGKEYITLSFEIVENLSEVQLSQWREQFLVGISALLASSESIEQQYYIDIVLQGCSALLHSPKYGAMTCDAFEAAVQSLRIVAMEDMPIICKRMQKFFIEAKHSTWYRPCCECLLNTIQSTQDTVRLTYLAEQYHSIV